MDFLLQRSDFPLLGPLIRANLADRYLFDGDLAAFSIIHTNVDVAKGAMPDHLSLLPLRDGVLWLLGLVESLSILAHVVVQLLLREVSIFVPVVKVILELFVVAIGELALAEGRDSIMLNLLLLLLLLLLQMGGCCPRLNLRTTTASFSLLER